MTTSDGINRWVEGILKLVQFNPDKIRDGIKECHERAAELEQEKMDVIQLAAALEQLLRLQGHSLQQSEAVDESAVKKQETIESAAVKVIRESGGRAHGKVIVEGLKAKGFLKTSKHPMNQVINSLRKSEFAEKDSRIPNTWRLKARE